MGCFRNLDEILIWADADNQQRKQILQNCAERRNNKPSLGGIKIVPLNHGS